MGVNTHLSEEHRRISWAAVALTGQAVLYSIFFGYQAL